jgi:hypothetical protein
MKHGLYFGSVRVGFIAWIGDCWTCHFFLDEKMALSDTEKKAKALVEGWAKSWLASAELEEKKPVTCPTCDGRGVNDAHEKGDGYGGPCPDCNGTGLRREKK